ncbi:Uncharacterized protein dnm_080100 [Desulfonema magnum]|uniref:Uncharacterized protein n=1 Tax=Desulfonema magnum TaxID=45655 RepID=A0A975BUV8_9BACT|nr:Uncharacterized protein dnm_080100 [Desulfonema magnum]
MSADLVDNFEYVGMKAARGFPEKNIPAFCYGEETIILGKNPDFFSPGQIPENLWSGTYTRCSNFFCHSCESRNPQLPEHRVGQKRIPAFGGMTGFLSESGQKT